MNWPTANLYPGGVIPSWAKFGARSGSHTGLDIGHKYGQAVFAAESGTVSWVGDMKAGGWQVRIDHGNGLETRYNHVQPTSILVKKGDIVTEGQTIAKVGHSGLEYVAAYAGKLTSAAHLHFEVLKDGKQVDPEIYLNAGGGALVALLTGAAIIIASVYGG